MEDPIVFDVWGTALSTAIVVARALVGATGTAHPAVARSVMRSAASGTPMLIGTHLGWDAARALRGQANTGYRDVRVYQAGYGPTLQTGTQHCQTHDLYHGGVLGCPVCGQHAAP
jgi:hypothetical protein